MAEQYSGTPGTTASGDSLFTAGILQASLSSRKVQAIVALAWDGPQIACYSVSLGLGEQPEKVEGLGRALALAAGAESCRVTQDGGRLLLELAKPADKRRALMAGRLEGLDAPSKTAVPAGITTGGRVLWWDLAGEAHCHTVIGGTTGSGKSVLLHWLLYKLARQNTPAELRFLLIDPKRFELQQFRQSAHLLHPIVSDSLRTAQVLAWVAAELDRRADSGRTVPRLVIVVEEVADVVQQNREIAPMLARVAQIGRALGVHLVVTTQQPGAHSLGRALANFPCRMLGRVASATLTYGASGRARSGADTLLGRGDFVLLAAGGTVRFQAPLADGRQWAQIPRTDTVSTLDDDLPAMLQFADRNRDPRGGRGARPLADGDYQGMQQALDAGADADDLRADYRIGWARARRIEQEYKQHEER